MMLGANYGAQQEPQSYDPFIDRASFDYAYSIWPRRCYNTGRWIWGRAVLGRNFITGPGEPVVEDRWYHRHEAMIMMLKKVRA